MAIRIVLADDHAVVRDGLKLLLTAQADMEVVAQAANGIEAVHLSCELGPDIVLIDIGMPQLNGIEAARRIYECRPDTQIIILSMHATKEHIFRALAAGIQGYILKDSAGEEVIKAVRTVCAGKRYLSQRIAETVLDDYVRLRQTAVSPSPLESLSSREREVLQQVVEGKTSDEIAQDLSLSAKTVNTYRSRLMQKLGIKDLTGLVKFAIQHGLTPLE